MPMIQSEVGDSRYSPEEQIEDQAYLDEIKGELIALMRQMKSRRPSLDYIIIAIRTGDTSKVSVSKRREWLELARKGLRARPIEMMQAIVDHVSRPPASPIARWVILAHNGRMSVCSIADVDVSKPAGSA